MVVRGLRFLLDGLQFCVKPIQFLLLVGNSLLHLLPNPVPIIKPDDQCHRAARLTPLLLEVYCQLTKAYRSYSTRWT